MYGRRAPHARSAHLSYSIHFHGTVLYFQPDQAGNNLIIPRRDLISLARADQDRTDQVASNLIRL